MTGRLGGGHPVADQCESGTQFLLIELWSARVPPRRAGGSHAVAGPLGDQAPFELRDGAKDMKDQFAGGRGGVDFRACRKLSPTSVRDAQLWIRISDARISI